jgi:hypothetical protein
MIKQKQSGLLSGLWSFLEINSSNNLDQNNERKRKDFIIEELQNQTIINQTININTIKLAGQVIDKFQENLNNYLFSVVIFFLILINNILFIILITIKTKS